MRKNYVAPCAELIGFAPAEPVATNPWEWNPAAGASMDNKWGENIASVHFWFSFPTTELDGDSPTPS